MAHNFVSYEGGYDYDFVEDPLDRLVCKICHCPCREALISECCGQGFCKCCFDKVKSATGVCSQACPTCRTDPFIANPQPEADRRIKELKVYCPNMKDGCEWIGELSIIVNHKANQKCERCDKCHAIVHYSDMHLNCPCHCPHCNVTASREKISSEHKEKCHKFPMSCPNNCGQENIARDDMDEHRKACPLEMVECEYCEDRITRNEVKKHNKKNIIKHNQLSCEKAFRNAVTKAEQVDHNILSSSHLLIAILFLILAMQTALLLQSYYTTATIIHNPDKHPNEEIREMIDQLQASKNIRELQKKNVELQETLNTLLAKIDQHGLDKEDGLKQAMLHYKEMQNNISVAIAQHLDELAQAKSYNKQLQNDMKIKEIPQTQKYKQSQPIVQQMDNETSKANYSEEFKELASSAYCTTHNPTKTESKLKELLSLSESVYVSYNSNDDDESLWSLILYLSNEMPNQVAPAVILKMSDFANKMKNKEKWYSNPFFAFEEGYQMQLQVGVAGRGSISAHMSIYLCLMKGPHDDKLEQSGHWPMGGRFTIELLNQLNDSDHLSTVVQFHEHKCSKCTNRVLEGVRAQKLGSTLFMSHNILLHHNYSGYRINDSLTFRISYEDVEPSYQVAPVTFKVTHFRSQWVKNKEEWHSSPFFAFVGGYQMLFTVTAVGNYDGENTRASACLHLMKGPHDDNLNQLNHWPLKGEFTIQLLNQIDNSYDHLQKVNFGPSTPHKISDRVVNGVFASHGWCTFISHEIFLHNKYLKSDTLYFRISYQELEGSTWIRLLIIILIKCCVVIAVIFVIDKYLLPHNEKFWKDKSFLKPRRGHSAGIYAQRMCRVAEN